MKYAGETLADPIEGREDGLCKAIVMIGGDGVPFINWFRARAYDLPAEIRRAAVRARLAAATDAVAELVRLDGMAELNAVESHGAGSGGGEGWRMPVYAISGRC